MGAVGIGTGGTAISIVGLRLYRDRLRDRASLAVLAWCCAGGIGMGTLGTVVAAVAC